MIVQSNLKGEIMTDDDLGAYVAQLANMLILAMADEGVSEDVAKNMIRPRFEQILSEAEDSAEEVGTLWASGKKAKSRWGKQAMAHIKSNLDNKRADGVRDEDIVTWWNMSDLVHRVLLERWNMQRLGILVFIAQNFEDAFEASSKEEYMDQVGAYAAQRSRGITPYFTYEPNPANAGKPERGLPMELMLRVSDWLPNFVAPGFDVDNDDIENLNARIRREIAAGNI
jgi:hypothetical protein